MRQFEVRWKNFRGLEDTGWIGVRPITILVGPNNSGKSSVLAPLLLLKQTLRSRNPELALQARGELINAGGYRDLVTNHEIERNVEFSLRWLPPDQGEAIPKPQSPPAELRLTFAFEDEEIVLAAYAVNDEFGRRLLTRRRLASGRYSLQNFPIQRKRDSTASEKRIERAARNAAPHHFLFRGGDAISAVIGATSGEDAPAGLTDYSQLYIAVTSWVENRVVELLSNLSYLGPLREPLRRVYEISGDPPRDVGTRGEFAPEILFRHPVLLKETREWLTRFGFGRSVQTRPAHEAAFSLFLSGRPSVNAADAGFGASQVLPLIVQGLFGPTESTLVTEQPEIHLNPRLQTEVADFFCHLAANGRGVIAETHSEHLLLRLRTLIARGLVPEEDVALYFVGKKSGRVRIKPIPVTSDGRIRPKDWPPGFFQESVQEALALASAQANRS